MPRLSSRTTGVSRARRPPASPLAHCNSLTNIAPNNPYRPWLECIADWPLVERSAEDLRALIASVADDCTVETQRDNTGLAELVTVHRRSI